MSRRQQVLIDTHATREQAAELLRTLEESRKSLEAQLAGEQREDVVKLVTGRSALDQAIADTRRMVESLDRAMSEARNGLSDDELEAREAGMNEAGGSGGGGESDGFAVHVVGRIGRVQSTGRSAIGR